MPHEQAANRRVNLESRMNEGSFRASPIAPGTLAGENFCKLIIRIPGDRLEHAYACRKAA